MRETAPAAIILAGGKGSRLREVVSDRPKPMAEVAGRPFLEWLLLALRAQGLRRVVLATGYQAEMIEEYFGDGARWGLDVQYAREHAPLGTGGAARGALGSASGGRLLVLNGDSFCPFDLGQLAQAHTRARACATLWLVAVDDCSRYGTVDVSADRQVVAFREKSSAGGAGLISAGVYLFERSTLEEIAPDRPVSLETEVFPSLIGRGLYAVVGRGPFLDIGTPESYALAERFIVEHSGLWRGVL
jgi:NDP-sugar pyrophosphorylase family protein